MEQRVSHRSYPVRRLYRRFLKVRPQRLANFYYGRYRAAICNCSSNDHDEKLPPAYDLATLCITFPFESI